MERREFEGNVLVTISDNEVRLWVCNNKGANIFRFKAIGKVYAAGQDVTVLAKEMFNKKEVKSRRERVVDWVKTKYYESGWCIGDTGEGGVNYKLEERKREFFNKKEVGK